MDSNGVVPGLWWRKAFTSVKMLVVSCLGMEVRWCSAQMQVAPLPKDLLDRRVEITGPVDRKMVINALNSGALVYMADFEDSTAPTWYGLLAKLLQLLAAAVHLGVAFTRVGVTLAFSGTMAHAFFIEW